MSVKLPLRNSKHLQLSLVVLDPESCDFNKLPLGY